MSHGIRKFFAAATLGIFALLGAITAPAYSADLLVPADATTTQSQQINHTILM